MLTLRNGDSFLVNGRVLLATSVFVFLGRAYGLLEDPTRPWWEWVRVMGEAAPGST